MLDQDDIRKLIRENERRLQKRREQKARFGISADPSIDIEIEDIQAEIKRLEKELIESGGQAKPSPIVSTPQSEASITVSSENRKENTQLAKKSFWDYLRDPLWQGISALIAVIALGWAIYTFSMGGEVSRQVSPTQTSAAGVIASIPTSTDTLTPTQTPTAASTTPTSTLSPTSTPTSTDTATATPTVGEIALAPTDTPTPISTPTETTIPNNQTTSASVIPASSCPDWLVTPEPSKGVLFIENHYGFNYDGEITLNSESPVYIADKKGDEPGRAAIQLSPGHYGYKTTIGRGWITEGSFDIEDGQLLMLSIYYDFDNRKAGGGIDTSWTPPAGCL